MDKLPSDILCKVLDFVSYFELDEVLTCFNLSNKQLSDIKYKIYKLRLTITHKPTYIAYRVEGKLHREEGLPAIEFTNGNSQWWINNCLHRKDDLPAVVNKSTYEWYKQGELYKAVYDEFEYYDFSDSSNEYIDSSDEY